MPLVFMKKPECNESEEQQVAVIENLLKEDIRIYTRDNIVKLLKTPETMTFDSYGRICVIFNCVDIYDSNVPRCYIVFASPVAMALYLHQYSLAKALIKKGYKYDAAARFEMFYVDNISDSLRFCISSGDFARSARLYSSKYNIFRITDVSNFELITGLLSVPKSFVEGVWNELSEGMEKVYIYRDIFKYIEIFCDVNIQLQTSNIAPSLCFIDDEDCLSEHNESLIRVIADCIGRVNASLKRLYDQYSDGNGCVRTLIKPGVDHSSCINTYDSFRNNCAELVMYSMDEFIVCGHAFYRSVENFYLLCVKLIKQQNDAADEKENTPAALDDFLGQYYRIVCERTVFGGRFIKSVYEMFDDDKSCKYILTKYLYLLYLCKKNRSTKAGKKYLNYLCDKIVSNGINEKKLFDDCMKLFHIVNDQYKFFANYRMFKLAAAKEIRNRIEAVTGIKFKPLIFDGRKSYQRDFVSGELRELNALFIDQQLFKAPCIYDPFDPSCDEVYGNLTYLDGVKNYDITKKSYEYIVNNIVETDNNELLIFLISKGIVNEDNAGWLLQKCVLHDKFNNAPFLLALMKE